MPTQRETLWDAVAADADFDVAVIGGGVNGIGVFRDLSLQGLRVVLIEREDFASGCSAAPSRMIHGGLRYLENGEFDLVRESLRERDGLLRTAPHMVRPLPTVIPITSMTSGLFNSAAAFLGWQGRPSRRGALPIKAGLWIYDRFDRKSRAMPAHRFLGSRATRARWPDLTPDARLSAVYHDAWISHPERLCIEMIGDTLAAAPQAVALNYASIRRDGEDFFVRDLPTGRDLSIRPRVIVHATGAWLDQSVGSLVASATERMVAGTKGSHLVLDNPALLAALDGHMVYFENRDGRVCIVFPYLGRVLAGSTDTRVDAAARTRCEPEERDYILGSLRLIFPGIAMTPEQVVFSYSGIRPLPKSGHSFTGRISRGHFLKRIEGPVPQVCMIGGKWTTFRAFAEQTADMVLGELGRSRVVGTFDLPIGGGRYYHADAALGDTVSPDRAAHLLGLYGAAAAAVDRFCRDSGPDEALPGTCHSRAEVVRILRAEHARTLADIVLRRTAMAIRGEISTALIDALGDIVAAERSLAPEARDAEKQALIDELDTWHGVSRATLDQRNRMGGRQCA